MVSNMDTQNFVSTRLVKIFADGSELLCLVHRGGYVWRRLDHENNSFREVVIPAFTDGEALAEVGRISNEEYLNHMMGRGLCIR